jgi:hypothetical protein
VIMCICMAMISRTSMLSTPTSASKPSRRALLGDLHEQSFALLDHISKCTLYALESRTGCRNKLGDSRLGADASS